MQIFPQCHQCKHYSGGLLCAAFSRIPNEIIVEGQHDHREPYPGDHGIRFEPVTDDRGTEKDEPS